MGKNALLAFGKLRREIRAISGEAKVAPVLTQYSKSLMSVLDIFKALLDEQFPERKAKGLDLPTDQEEQVLRLEEVEQRQTDAVSSGLQMATSNSTDVLCNGKMQILDYTSFKNDLVCSKFLPR